MRSAFRRQTQENCEQLQRVSRIESGRRLVRQQDRRLLCQRPGEEDTRAFAKKFYERMKRMPHMGDAGDYSSTMHYLKAMQAAGSRDAKAVMAKMREMPVNDFFAKGGKIREDGRMVHDMYVYEVKKPSESKGEWDYLKLRATIPAAEAYRPLSESKCPLVQK